MTIQRNELIFAIISAYKNRNFTVYTELLELYYRLLKQESINGDYINKITCYHKISNEALKAMSR